MKLKNLSTLILILLVSSSYAINLKGCYPKKFIVSGYYSPTKYQKFYYRGNYRLETKLNGKGIRGASGKPVFNGMLAAPKKYPFGTKIYFPGYGVGQVEDRGNAIVSAGRRGNKYDRIDIWMGKGEKGLIRALSFGKKVLIGYVCPPTKKLKVGFNRNSFPIYKNNFFDITLWTVSLRKGRKDGWVKALQKYLSKLGFFPKNLITGYFGNITKKALCKYQLKYGIVKSKYDRKCGYFGPKTRNFMKKQLIKLGILKKNFYKTYIIPAKLKKKKIKKNKPKQLTYLKINFTRGFLLGEKNKKIKILQKYLKKLGYYNGPINGIYTSQTANAVYKFQLNYKIISGKEDPKILGYFGPKTRKIFLKVIKEKLGNS